jgi:hypothetical protein
MHFIPIRANIRMEEVGEKGITWPDITLKSITGVR